MARIYTRITYYATTVKDLEKDGSFSFVSDYQDVKAILDTFKHPDVADYDSFFVQVLDGDYGKVYGMGGIIPYLYKSLDLIELVYE